LCLHRYDDVRLEPDQLAGEVGQPVELALSPSVLQDTRIILWLST
jgi:hypothetical protein